MARTKAIDPFMTGWFIEVISLGKGNGYEWLLIPDRYISYRSESLSAVASERGIEWAHDAALETAWTVQEVVEAIDKGWLRDINDEKLNIFISKASWSGALRVYVDAAITERIRRTSQHNEYIW